MAGKKENKNWQTICGHKLAKPQDVTKCQTVDGIHEFFKMIIRPKLRENSDERNQKQRTVIISGE